MLRELDAASSYIPGRLSDPPIALKIKPPKKPVGLQNVDDNRFVESAHTDKVDIDTSWIDADPEASRDGVIQSDALSTAITTSVPRTR